MSRFFRLEEESVRPQPLFYFCKESREVAFESYEFYFSTCIKSTYLLTEEPRIPSELVRPVPHLERTWAGISFQPACDTIYLGKTGLLQILAHAKADELETGISNLL